MSNLSHGLRHHVSYDAWKHMMQRCYSKTYKEAKNYKRRGIKVCERWHDVKNFIEDMGERPEGYSLDRIDNDKGYYKENCRWVPTTGFEQANNTTRNQFITFEGLTKTRTQWARFLHISPIRQKVFTDRLYAGYSLWVAACTPYGAVFNIKPKKKNNFVVTSLAKMKGNKFHGS